MHSSNLVMAMFLVTVPSSVMAQNVSIDLVSGAYPGPYVGELDGGSINPGTQFILWSIIHTDIPLDGIEYRLHVNGDADNDKFDLVGYATGPHSGYEWLYGFTPGFLDGLGDAFSHLGPSASFNFLDYDKQTVPASLDAIPVSEVLSSSPVGTVDNLEGKALIGYIIKANADFTPGYYEFSALGSIGSGPSAEWSSGTQTGLITEGAGFVLTPEPASALLLLGAVPFLRRRRN